MQAKYKLNKMDQLFYKKTFIPEDKDAALLVGSGDLMVLSTPSLIASMENVAMICAKSKLQDGFTTVGTFLNVKHMKASKIGEPYTVTATLTEEDGRKLVFHVNAIDNAGNVLGEGTHERFIVNAERFMSKL